MSKTVLVIGGVKNSGRAVAERFASEGYQIALTSRTQEEADKAALEISERFHVVTKGYQASLMDVPEARGVIRSVKETFGTLDCMIYVSANLAVGISTLEATEEQYDAVMNPNGKCVFFCVQEAGRIMKEQGHGSIVLFSSVQAFGALRGRVLYGNSKAAINSLVKYAAYELGEYGVRINAVAPGAIRTDRWDGISEEEIAVRRARWPMKLESTPENVAEAVWYLGSDLSPTVTGAVLPVDSGVLACLQGYDGGEFSEASLARKQQDTNIKKGIR